MTLLLLARFALLAALVGLAAGLIYLERRGTSSRPLTTRRQPLTTRRQERD